MTIWNEYVKIVKDLKAQQERIEKKRATLESKGMHLDTTSVGKPKEVRSLEDITSEKSIWQTLELKLRELRALKDYQDRLERTIDADLAKG